jgi:hypothetical protein
LIGNFDLFINSFTRKDGKPIEYSLQMKQIMISEMLLSGLSYRSIGLSSADAKHAYAFPLDDNIQREHNYISIQERTTAGLLVSADKLTFQA